MVGFEINWPVVALRILDGSLYGTGFVLALLLWYGFINTANKRSEKKKKKTSAEQSPVSLEYGHYRKDIRHLWVMDIYRFLRLYEVYDPCLQHAIKKLACAGRRGAKSPEQDIQEALDSIYRYQEMQKEDADANR